MEYYNNILCVTCEELTSGDNAGDEVYNFE